MRKMFIIGLAFLIAASVAPVRAKMSEYKVSAGGEPVFKKIMNYKPSLVTTVYARDGSVLGRLYREKRFLKRIKEMPPDLIMAFLASEDASFYEHEGVDISAIFRAFSKNVSEGEIVQGGSTITQQVVKRLLLSSEKSYVRKLKEAILAYRLERCLSKDDILTIYLNDIFLGAGAYGVEAAARTFFGKHVEELSLAECALLAGLPKAPTSYNPFRHPEAAKQRQKYVLGRMLELNWIEKGEYEKAMAAPLAYKGMPDPTWELGAYYLEEVRRWLIDNLDQDKLGEKGIKLERYGEDAVYELGLHVYTAVDLKHQAAAERALRAGLVESAKRRGWTGPADRLKPGEFDAFLAGQKGRSQSFEPGTWVKVLTTKVSKSGAEVRIGDLKGFINVSTMSWCRKPNPARAPENAAKAVDARKVLAPGDVVWAVVQEEKAKDGPLSLALTRWPEVQGALVSLEPPTGEVVALVGGYDFNESQFNRATQAHRQPGSAFKPIVYSAALDSGYTPASVVNDRPLQYFDPTTFKVWQPKNYSGKFFGPTMLTTALVKSRNLVTVQVAEKIGINRVILQAKRLGLTPDFPEYLAVCLGSEAVTPINLCQAYTAFARGGSWVRPRLVISVQDAWGKEILKPEPEAREAISPQNAFVMASLLKEVVRRGTGVKAKVLGRPLAGKTGTTNDEKDAWFIGFSPYLLSGVYVGFDQLAPMGSKETGSRAALPIWVDYRKEVEELYPVEDFAPPPNIVFERVAQNGRPTSSEAAGSLLLPFIEGTEPSLYSIYGEEDEYTEYGEPAFVDEEDYLLKQIF